MKIISLPSSTLIVKKLQGNKWQIEGGSVLKEGKVYVPKNEELRVKIIQLHHDVLVAGYGGRWKTTKLVMRNYWWPGVTKYIEKYIDGCNMCQRMKNGIYIPAEKLHTLCPCPCCL